MLYVGKIPVSLVKLGVFLGSIVVFKTVVVNKIGNQSAVSGFSNILNKYAVKIFGNFM